MSLLITSFFTRNGNPQTGLVPTIRIWEVSGGSHMLIIGSPDPSMTEVGDGIYKFEFTAGLGYNPNKNYVIRADGGATQLPRERYQVSSTDEVKLELNTIQQIVNGVWDEPAILHLVPGSMGTLQNQTAADAAAVNISVATLNNLVQTLLKYERNRTKIDKVAKTLTVYDDDCTTVLQVFNLLDSTGTPSVTEVCERKPTTCP